VIVSSELVLARDSKHDTLWTPASMEDGVTRSVQSRGGEARALALSTEQRREIASQAARARWAKINDPNALPTASLKGPLTIGDVTVQAYRLNDGRRVISKKGMAAVFTLKSSGGNAFLRSMTRPGVRSEIGEKLWETIQNPIYFKIIDPDSGADSGATADGYEADTLIEVCKAIVSAWLNRKLHGKQYFLFARAEIIMRAAAKLGITALVDNAVGYRPDVTLGEYQKLFQKFILDECRQWEQEFPDKYLDMIYRLYGLRRINPDSTKSPKFFGKFTRKYIYFPLAHSNGAILAELDKKNPAVYASGGRKYKMFQFLEEKVGLSALRQHLWQVIGIGQVSANKEQFDRNFYKAFPEAIPIGFQYDLIGPD
jgi:hypothetical protein